MGKGTKSKSKSSSSSTIIENDENASVASSYSSGSVVSMMAPVTAVTAATAVGGGGGDAMILSKGRKKRMGSISGASGGSSSNVSASMKHRDRGGMPATSSSSSTSASALAAAVSVSAPAASSSNTNNSGGSTSLAKSKKIPQSPLLTTTPTSSTAIVALTSSSSSPPTTTLGSGGAAATIPTSTEKQQRQEKEEEDTTTNPIIATATPERGRPREQQSSTNIKSGSTIPSSSSSSAGGGGGFFAMAGRSLRSLSRSSRSSRGTSHSSTGTSGTTSLALDLQSIANKNNNINKNSEPYNMASYVANYNNGTDNNSSNNNDINTKNSIHSVASKMEQIITVTSCRSDAYYDQKRSLSSGGGGGGGGSTISKLPRRAPAALKTFHELAVGIKDAYDAGGCVPRKPMPRGSDGGGMNGKKGGEGNTVGDGIPSVIGGDPTMADGGSSSNNNSNNSGSSSGKENEENHTESSNDGIELHSNDLAIVAGGSSSSQQHQLTDAEWSHQSILFEFMGNLDFLLALVDEVALDTATRGALKEDTTFRGLRDVIKKCNKVLESMLVRRERKYTLLFRLVGVDDTKYLTKIQQWNARVEKALGGVTQDFGEDGSSAASSWRSSKQLVEGGDEVSEAGSEASSMSSSSARSSVSAVLRRGRELLPSAGKVRARRATPTPRMRRHNRDGDGAMSGSGDHNSAGEDGYSSDTVPMTTENLAKLQFSLDVGQSGGSTGGGGDSRVSTPSINDLHGDKKKNRGDGAAFGITEPSGLGQVKPMKPKDELLDVIRGLRSEQMRAREAVGGTASADSRNVLDEIKSNFTPKAEIPSAVPKLPIEYIHRHRLMKQVVNCLLDRNTGPKDTDDLTPFANNITCITSRHSDKAGNGKTTLAVAAIQTVEVREFFTDGIAWIHLGRTALGEREVRRMYEQLYDQLLGGEDEEDEDEDGNAEKDDDDDNISNSSGDSSDEDKDQNDNEKGTARKDPPKKSVSQLGRNKLAPSRRSFQGGELEGIKEDLGKLLLSRRVLICLDDVYKMDDAKWFLFGTNSEVDHNYEDASHRVLITTRIPGLVGPGVTHEVFVRIFSEHEAVKLLLTAAGRRPNGLPKVSPVFSQARIIVKGCGNSPLALRIAGGMLRSRNRNWTLSSPAWKLLVDQCRTSLEEASRIRSFANSVQRLVDLSFATVTSIDFRNVLRECFVAFAMVFHDTDSLKVGKGISRAVVIRLFAVVSSMEGGSLPSSAINEEELRDYMDNAALILDTLETMNLVQRAGHGLSKSSAMNRLGNGTSDDVANTNGSNHKCYSMHESIKAIAEDMAKRKTEAFAPIYDEFNSFISNADIVPTTADRLFPYDECMVMMITGRVSDMLGPIQNSLYERWNIEEYIAENMPLHLIRARMIEKAANVLIDSDFCTRRVVALGPIEATRRHVSDLIELRRVHAHYKDSGLVDMNLNIVDAIQEGSACIIGEVIRQSQDPHKSVNVAICLSTMGEGLIKARQPRDASQRLEEAASLYRELLGQGHIDVARAVNAVAKSLVKINETRAALIRFGEASSTYEDCSASHHFDSIANLQGMANLFVTSGDFQAATALYENVISRKKSVHGEFSVVTAKTINDYAVILAKNGRMDDALARYEQATATYERALEGLPPSMSWLNHGESAAKCGFDMALINLNIASIKSKKGDTEDAIAAYTIGVQGLRQYKQELELAGDEAGKNKNSSHMRHLVSALGRIGSLKLKLGDKNGALETYASLFNEVDNTESPMASRLEKAKAHIKCATIYRQSGEKEDNKHAIIHLREAYNMYNGLYGKNHKDTVAVATSLQQWEEEQRP